MKNLLLIFNLALAFAAATSLCLATPAAAQNAMPGSPVSPPAKDVPVPPDQKNAHQARDLLELAIKALGGDAYLHAHDLQEQGRVYSFYHGRPTSNGVFFWRFLEFPDKERIELTQQRDVAYIYVGNKGYEVTYKGSREIEKKDLDDYVRRHTYSLETILRFWVNDPNVALFSDGNALAGNMAAQRVTLINSKNQAVSVYFDIDTHLPIRKTYSWRDPTDNERNTEDESFDGYRLVQGIMTPFGFTRYFNGDMQTERFVTTVTYSQELDQAMFDPNSGYNPMRIPEKHKKDAGK